MLHTEACRRVSSRLGNPLKITEDPSRLLSRDLLLKDIHASLALTESQGMAGVHSTWSTMFIIRTHIFVWMTGLTHSSRYPWMAPLACVGAVSPQISCKRHHGPSRVDSWETRSSQLMTVCEKNSFTKVLGQLTHRKTASMISKILLAITVSNHLLFGAPKYSEILS